MRTIKRRIDSSTSLWRATNPWETAMDKKVKRRRSLTSRKMMTILSSQCQLKSLKCIKIIALVISQDPPKTKGACKESKRRVMDHRRSHSSPPMRKTLKMRMALPVVQVETTRVPIRKMVLKDHSRPKQAKEKERITKIF